MRRLNLLAWWVPWSSWVLWPARPMGVRPSYGLAVLVPMS
jgi:hypothetical protein